MATDAADSLFPPPIISMEWGLEGYHLWMVTRQKTPDDVDSNSSCHSECGDTTDNKLTEENVKSTTNLLQFQFVKSALTVNPCAVSFSIMIAIVITNF